MYHLSSNDAKVWDELTINLSSANGITKTEEANLDADGFRHGFNI